MVAALRWAGVSDGGGASPSDGIDNSSAKSGSAAASDATRGANAARNFSIRTAAESAAAKWAARDRCLMIGNSALSL